MHIQNRTQLTAVITELYGHVRNMQRKTKELDGENKDRAIRTVTNINHHIIHLEKML